MWSMRSSRVLLFTIAASDRRETESPTRGGRGVFRADRRVAEAAACERRSSSITGSDRYRKQRRSGGPAAAARHRGSQVARYEATQMYRVAGVIESRSIEQVRRSLSPRTIIPTLLLPVPPPPGPPGPLRCGVSVSLATHQKFIIF